MARCCMVRLSPIVLARSMSTLCSVRVSRGLYISGNFGMVVYDNKGTIEDCMANAQMTFRAITPEDVYIYGDQGYIRIPKIHWGRGAMLYGPGDERIEEFYEEMPEGFYYEVQEVVRCLKQGLTESETASHAMTLEAAEIYERFVPKV